MVGLGKRSGLLQEVFFGTCGLFFVSLHFATCGAGEGHCKGCVLDNREMITRETKDKIMEAVHIEDVVGDFVSLKKRGANHIGCCPFHNEKTPSFYVSPSKGIFKCFGCGKAGDAVTFVMEHEHYTYPEALQYLAKKYNIEVEEEQMTPEQKERNNERDALFHVSEFAQKYFADLLFNDEMGRAVGLSYFHNRGMSDEIIKTFGLGYCLEERDNFTKKAKAEGYSDKVLEKSGLTIYKEGGKCYDRFRGRVMFPIYSISGRVLGFSGRILSKEAQAAKYVNSPDSEIYDKSHTLYGIYQAKSAISKEGKCYLVEGNVDVVSMHQSGVCNTVASCGTSLTVEQIRLIKRYTPNVTVVYDGDKAGIKATIRATDLLFAEGMHVSMVLFPDDDDPDSYAQKYGSTKLQEYLREHEDNFIIYKTKTLVADYKRDPIKKAEVVREIVQTIALVPDLLERTEYVSQCAALMQMPEQTLNNELAKIISANKRKAYEKQHPQETKPAEGPEQPPVQGTAEEVADKVAPTEEQRAAQQAAQTGDEEEARLIKLLLNHGRDKVKVKTPKEDGSTEVNEYYAAAVIIGLLKDDDITLKNPVYSTIFDTCKEQLLKGEVLGGDYFIQHDDPEVRNAAISLMIDTYKLSDLWQEKSVHIPSEDERLLPDVMETVNSYKLQQVNAKIEEIDSQLKSENNADDTDILIAKKMQYQKLKRDICTLLNRVIC